MLFKAQLDRRKSFFLGSPFKCEISEGETAATPPRAPVEIKQATASGDGLKEVVLGAPAFFEIDTNGTDGLVDVKIIGIDNTINQRFLNTQKN